MHKVVEKHNVDGEEYIKSREEDQAAEVNLNESKSKEDEKVDNMHNREEIFCASACIDLSCIGHRLHYLWHNIFQKEKDHFVETSELENEISESEMKNTEQNQLKEEIVSSQQPAQNTISCVSIQCYPIS